MQQECQEIVGKVHKVYYQNTENGYMIINIKTPNDEGNKTVKGYNLPNKKNILYRFTGRQVSKPGNRFFQADSYMDVGKEEVNAETGTGVIEYLTSGLFPGIGFKTAMLIVERFGDKSIEIVENETEKLAEIKGISAVKISKIMKNIEQNRFMQEFTKEMLQYGITAPQCAKLIVIYGKEALNKIHENPYRLIKDIRLPFQKTDEIAKKMNIDPNSNVRLDAAFQHVFNETYKRGDTGIELQRLGADTKSLLGDTSEEKINARCLVHMQSGLYRYVQFSMDGSYYIFTDSMVQKEQEICDSIVRLKRNTIEPIENIRKKIAEIEDRKGIILDFIQIQAIETALKSSLSIITGGPGTGKTTIMDIIVAIYENEAKKEAILLAPTGKAARKLSESTGHLAKTIHSWFNVYDLDADIDTLPIDDIKNRMVIIDEASMLDIYTANLILKHLKEGSRLVLVGDIDQLPSVAPGAILRDLINSKICSTIKLDRIFRAEEKSLINNNAQNINHGIKDLKQGDDFHMYRESDPIKCRELMTELYKKRAAQYGIEGTVMLLPYRKGPTGTIEMNKHLQSIVNPPSEDKEEGTAHGRIYRVGDVVMNMRNTKEVSNGDTGIVVYVKTLDGSIEIGVAYNNDIVIYDRDRLEDLELAYATTIHKSQGSEAPSVITSITNQYEAMLYRSIVYVAFSRAKKVIDVVYDEALFRAIETERSNKRITLLPYFLRKESSEIVYDMK